MTLTDDVRGVLAGSPQRIRRRWEAGVAGPGVTGLIVSTEQPAALELMADLAGLERRTKAP